MCSAVQCSAVLLLSFSEVVSTVIISMLDLGSPVMPLGSWRAARSCSLGSYQPSCRAHLHPLKPFTIYDSWQHVPHAYNR